MRAGPALPDPASRPPRPDGRVLLLGIVQSLFESAMYIFVFMWTPTLEAGVAHDIPHGVVFATFMVSIMVGSYLFNSLNSAPRSLVEDFARYIFLVAGIALAVPTFSYVRRSRRPALRGAS